MIHWFPGYRSLLSVIDVGLFANGCSRESNPVAWRSVELQKGVPQLESPPPARRPAPRVAMVPSSPCHPPWVSFPAEVVKLSFRSRPGAPRSVLSELELLQGRPRKNSCPEGILLGAQIPEIFALPMLAACPWLISTKVCSQKWDISSAQKRTFRT